MTQAEVAFTDLLRRARNGETSALGELARLYEAEVRVMARVLLGPALRPYLDSMDLVQSVHRSLLVGMRQQKFDFSRPEQLVALALTMVRRKVSRQWRRHRRQQRLPVGPADSGKIAQTLASLVRAAPDPAKDVQLQDSLRHLCEQLSDAEREMLNLRLLGYSTAEVARELDLDADVLRVRLSRLRQRLRGAGMIEEWL